MMFTINGCSIDTDAYEIRRDGSVIPVEPQVFDLLVQLLENRDRVVTKDEIIERIWHGRAVSETALSSRIKAVRHAIGDDGASQACIRTIRRRGFRVVAEVTESVRPTGIRANEIASVAPSPSSDQSEVAVPAVAATRAAERDGIRAAGRWRIVALSALVAAVVLGSAPGWYALTAARVHMGGKPPRDLSASECTVRANEMAVDGAREAGASAKSVEPEKL